MQAVRAVDDKGLRQARLLEILEEKFISSPADLVDEMTKAGFQVTQASVNEDFEELGVVKVAGRYVSARQLTPARRSAVVSDLIRKIEPAGPNLIVVKTDVGGAGVVAAAIDRAELEGVVGTVAGDDTLFIATESRAKQTRVIGSIMQLL